jgi:hypothetical protein
MVTFQLLSSVFRLLNLVRMELHRHPLCIPLRPGPFRAWKCHQTPGYQPFVFIATQMIVKVPCLHAPFSGWASPPSWLYYAPSGLGSFRFTSFLRSLTRNLEKSQCLPTVCPTSVFRLLSSVSCLPTPVRVSERLNIRTSECPISASPFLLKLIPLHFCLNQKQTHSKLFCALAFSIFPSPFC